MGLIFNNKEIWAPSREVLYQIPSRYDGFFLSGNSGVADIRRFKSIPGSNALTLSKSIEDCDNGILVYLSNKIANKTTYGSQSESIYVPNPPVSTQKLIIKKDSPSASMTYGWTTGGGRTSTGNVSVSGNKMKVTTDGVLGMYTSLSGEDLFWGITSIVSY